MSVINLIIKSLLFIIPTVVVAGFLTYAERKVIAKVQRRIGPNVVGPFGLLQPLADTIKLLSKEIIIPKNANKLLFLIAPIFILVSALMVVAVIPINENVVFADLNLGLIYFVAFSGIAIYGMLLTGWASASNYGILGSLRSLAQMISYEIPIGIVILCVALLAKSLNLTQIVLSQENMWNIIPLLPLAPVFLFGIFAKSHRAPFDLPEAENELVAGYNTEYSSSLFAMIFLGEYINMFIYSILFVIFFLGGWLPLFSELAFISAYIWFFIKVILVLSLFLISRTIFPRIKYDDLLKFNWKILVPFSMGYFMILATYVTFFRG